MSKTNLTTGDITMPVELADGIWKKAVKSSVLARLSKAIPQKFGQTNVMVLTGRPRAEIVGEEIQKSPSKATFGSKAVKPIKLQVTQRVTDEVKWADEDYKLGVLKELADACSVALGEALDIVGIHKVNPLTGAVAASVSEGICDTTNTVTVVDGKFDDAILQAAGAVIANGYSPKGIAVDDALGFGLASMKDLNGHYIYPELGFGEDMTSFRGLNAAANTTVSGGDILAEESDILGIVGNFDAFRWGVQRDIKVHTIETGDPDGQGDLSRTNEIALRAEIVYGIGIMDEDAFALILKEESAPSVTPPTQDSSQ